MRSDMVTGFLALVPNGCFDGLEPALDAHGSVADRLGKSALFAKLWEPLTVAIWPPYSRSFCSSCRM